MDRALRGSYGVELRWVPVRSLCLEHVRNLSLTSYEHSTSQHSFELYAGEDGDVGQAFFVSQGQRRATRPIVNGRGRADELTPQDWFSGSYLEGLEVGANIDYSPDVERVGATGLQPVWLVNGTHNLAVVGLERVSVLEGGDSSADPVEEVFLLVLNPEKSVLSVPPQPTSHQR